MNLSIEYTHPDAKVLSKKGNPIQLYALALAGYPFKAGGQVPLKDSLVITVFTGVKVSWDDPTIVGVLAGVANPLFPSLSVTNAGALVHRGNPQQELFLRVSSTGGDICIVDYGILLAELYFVKLAEIGV